jgi:hypothetical protein
LEPKNIDLYCRWLCQTPRADGKPRVLHIAGRKQPKSSNPQISALTDRIKQVGRGSVLCFEFWNHLKNRPRAHENNRDDTFTYLALAFMFLV